MTSDQPRRLITLASAILAATTLLGAQNGGWAGILLESGIQKEVVDGDLRGAIAVFNTIVSQYADERAIAAQALWHLGRCYEQLGNPAARRVFERLLREYGDQSALAGSARARLAALTALPKTDRPTDAVVRDLAARPTAPVRTGPTGQGNFVVFSDLAVHNLGTGESRRLTKAARSAAYPVVSTDGRVAYLSWSGNLEDLRQGQSAKTGRRATAELRVIRVNGEDDRLVTRSNDVPWLRPFAWSPDNRRILGLFERADGTTQIALVVLADGSTRILKTFSYGAPQAMSFSDDGRFIAYEMPSARDPRQIEIVTIAVEGKAAPAAERRYPVILGGEIATAPSDTQSALHVLNRLTFGPRPADLDRVTAMGIDAYIEEQLHPERVADPVVEKKLANFSTLRMGLPELLVQAGPVSPRASRRRATVFERREAADRAAQTGGAALTSDAMPVGEAAYRAMFRDRPPAFEVHSARLIRAVYSERQLNEVMVDFWMNHFSIRLGDHQFAAHFEEQAIRRNAMGRFEDMLFAVARHPSMLYYLDNWRSSAPADVVQARFSALKASAAGETYIALLQRAPFLAAAKGLNENYARELMELHTMGVDGGYTQQDIVELAKVLTGWTISARGLVNGWEEDGVFTFDPLLHVEGDKTVLGKAIKGGGVDEGEQVLKMLAHHPSTARFIATKLARRFVADDPPAAVVDAASRAFERTGGDIREVLRAIFASPQFRAASAYRSKIKKPLELVASALRAVNAEYDGNYGPLGGNNGVIRRMGERLYDYEAPDGNPDVGAAWMNSNALLVRLEFANALATNRLDGMKVDARAAQAFLERLGLPRPTPAQIAQTRDMMKAASAGGPSMSMMMRGGAAAAETEKPVDPEAVAVAAMLGSPQFQKR